MRWISCALTLAAFLAPTVFAQTPTPKPSPTPAPKKKPMSETGADKPADKQLDETKPTEAVPAPIVTEHQIIVNGTPLRYRVTTGMLPIKNGQTGETEANVFFIACTVTDGTKHTGTRRPVMFSFNGGPDSACQVHFLV